MRLDVSLVAISGAIRTAEWSYTGRMDRNAGFLPWIALGTLAIFYLAWAAMHDIAHGESDLTLEYVVLAASVPAFGLLYRGAMVLLPGKAQRAWLAGTAVLFLLLDLAALNATLHPKYLLDP